MEFSTCIHPYEPLRNGEIRLVQIEPGSFDSPLRCKLLTQSLSLQPAYTALSYVWGDPQRLVNIRLDGYEFPITQNLNCALRYIRQEEMPIVLWIDALCINQSDVQERTSQVKRMDRIYKSAMRVCIWVGEEHIENHPLFLGVPMPIERFFSRMVQIFHATSGAEHLDIHNPSTGPMEFQDEDVTIWQWCYSLMHFVTRPWFTRLWIVQEATTNSNAYIQCGQYWLPWISFLWSLEKSASTLQLRLQGLRTVEHFIHNAQTLWKCFIWYEAWQETSVPNSQELAKRIILLLLLLNGKFESQNMQDRIYAILGLVTTETEILSQELILVDYAQPTIEIFTKFTLFLIEELQTLDILMGYDEDTIMVEEFANKPSWVPTWGVSPSNSLRDIVLERSKWNTKGHLDYGISEDGHTLLVKGILVGKIDIVGGEIQWSNPEDSEKNSPEKQREYLTNYLKEGEEEFLNHVMPRGKYDDRNSAITAWKYALLHSTEYVDVEREHACYDLITHYETEERSIEEQEAVDESLRDFLIFSHLRSENKKPFILERGDIGSLANALDIDHGDYVYLFQGASIPFVLRNINGYSKFIGGCYIHGIMDDAQQEDILTRGKMENINLR